MTGIQGFTDTRLYPIHDKVAAGKRLNRQDGCTLFESPDLLGVGRLAQMVQGAPPRPQGLLHLQPAYQLLQHLRQRLQILRLQPQGRGTRGL